VRQADTEKRHLRSGIQYSVRSSAVWAEAWKTTQNICCSLGCCTWKCCSSSSA